jgi:hypothetical protein
MHKILDDGMRTLLSLSTDELAALTHAVRYASAPANLSEEEYIATFGVGLEKMLGLHAALCAQPHEAYRQRELIEAWEDHGAVMVRVMNNFGDPVELGQREAAELSKKLQQAISDS